MPSNSVSKRSRQDTRRGEVMALGMGVFGFTLAALGVLVNLGGGYGDTSIIIGHIWLVGGMVYQKVEK
jgi:hypothetical protein